MVREDRNCCCCELAVDLTLAAWEAWSGCLSPDATAEEVAENMAAMYARIAPVVASHCTCSTRKEE